MANVTGTIENEDCGASSGNNMDLIRVRARKIQCVCADMPTRLDETETQGEKE
jgi:hypothetical protein